MCSYLEAIEKTMAGSGFEDIVIQAGVYAGGFIDKVMAGKHYKLAIRIHQRTLDATETLLSEAFLVQHDNDLHITNDLQTLAESPTSN